MTVGKRIKELRKIKHLTQSQLGELLGVKKAAIQKYESGEIVNLKNHTIKDMAKIFEVEPAYIMGWDEFDAKYPVKEIQDELKVYKRIQVKFGNEGVKLYELSKTLNQKGLEKLISYAEDIQDKYKIQE